MNTMQPMQIPLAPLLHALAQALLYPVLALLLASVVYLAYQAGVFVGDWKGYGRAAGAAAGDPLLAAERLLAEEELALARRLEKTDLLVRLGPALGLAGTLIPLGPGLAALGRGEVQVLAAALTVAFDTTIIGILVGGVAFVLSSVRRRWFEGYIVRASARLEQRLHAGRPSAGVGVP